MLYWRCIVKDRAGYIHKEGLNYSVITKKGSKLRINETNFPSVREIGVAKMAWHVAHFIMLGGFADDATEEVRKEIKFTIGDKG